MKDSDTESITSSLPMGLEHTNKLRKESSLDDYIPIAETAGGDT